jgi:hypothetical protein
VQLLNGALGHTAVVVVDECKPSRSSSVAIGRNHNLHRIADRPEMLPDIGFGSTVREISDK